MASALEVRRLLRRSARGGGSSAHGRSRDQTWAAIVTQRFPAIPGFSDPLPGHCRSITIARQAPDLSSRDLAYQPAPGDMGETTIEELHHDHRADIRDVKEPCAGFGARPPANRAANGIGRPVLSDSGAATVAGSGAGGPIAAADRSLGLGNGRLDGGYGSSGASGLSRINSSSATTAHQGEAYA